MVTSNEINNLRKEGKLKEAYDLAVSELSRKPDDIWIKRALAWVYIDLLKNAAERDLPDKFLLVINRLKELKLPENESLIFENICWQCGKFIGKSKGLQTYFLRDFFNGIKGNLPAKPSDAYTFLLSSFVKRCDDKVLIYDFFKWWNPANFQEKDFEKREYNGKKIMPVAEQVFIAVAKKVIEQEPELEKVNELVNIAARLSENHPHMQFTKYYHAKLLLAAGNKEGFLETFIPFARRKRKEFWVWDLMSEVFEKDDPRYFACLCRSLACGAPVKFSLNVKEKLAIALIDKGMYDEARTEIEQVWRCRQDEGWKIPKSLTALRLRKEISYSKAKKSNADLYKKYAGAADDILFYDIDADIVVVEYVNEEKKVLGFVASRQKHGFFSYRDFDIKPQAGDVYSVRFVAKPHPKSPNYYKAVSIEPTDLDPPPEVYATFSGILNIKSGNSFGFVGEVFVPPALIAKHKPVNGQNIEVAALISFNKKKKEWAWKAVKILK